MPSPSSSQPRAVRPGAWAAPEPSLGLCGAGLRLTVFVRSASTTLAGAGHFLGEDRPEEFAEFVSGFMARESCR